MKCYRVINCVVVCILITMYATNLVAEPALVQLCPEVSKAVEIDGQVSAAEWSDAAVVSGFNVGEQRSIVGVQTLVYAKRTDKSLLIGIVMLEPQMDKLVVGGVGRDGKLWWNDSVEIFIDPGRSRKDYYHFIVGADGAVYDARVTDKGWDAKIESAVHRGKDRWSVELEIPFNALKANADAEQLWGINYCRTRLGKHPEGGAWSSVPHRNHQPRRFGMLYFSKTATIDNAEALKVARKAGEACRIFEKGGFVDVVGKKVSRYKFETADSETFKRSTGWAAKLRECCKTAKPSKARAEALKLLANWEAGATGAGSEQEPILKWVASCRASGEMVQKMRTLYWEVKMGDLYMEIDQ